MGKRFDFDWSKLSAEELYKLFHDKNVVLRKAPPWCGLPEQMPPGVKKGLGASVLITIACRGILGTMVNKEGILATRKSEEQKRIAKLPQEEIIKLAKKKLENNGIHYP